MQEKYDKAMALIADMEKRLLVAESSLDATIYYESGQTRALSSPRYNFLYKHRISKSVCKSILSWSKYSKVKSR